MKKLSLIVLAVAAISFSSCCGKKADASACCADSTAVVAADSTCCADSTAACTADSATCAEKKAEGCCPAESKK